jgi:hypothetical protein
LLPKTREVDQGMVKVFVDRLRTAGLTPDEVITDDSRLYPSVLADTWQTAMHQLCSFHATRRVVHAVNDVVTQVRRFVADATTGQQADLARQFASHAAGS